MEFKKLQYSVQDGIGTIQMTYPKNLNAIDEEMAEELLQAFQMAEDDTRVKIVVLKGGEKAFSAGGDIGFFYTNLMEKPIDELNGIFYKVGAVTEYMKKMGKLIIASVSGAAAGAGFSLALSSDFTICADNAKFIMAFVNIGLVPDTGGAYLLYKALGEKKAMELCITGRPVKAEEAWKLGLVYDVVPAADLLEETSKLASRLAQGPLLSYKNIKKQLYATALSDYHQYLEQAEIPLQLECIRSHDFAEGCAAFMEKRQAVFLGK